MIHIYIYNLYDTDPNKWHYNIYGQSFKYFIFENLQQFDTKTQNECCMDLCLRKSTSKKYPTWNQIWVINGINKLDLPTMGRKKWLQFDPQPQNAPPAWKACSTNIPKRSDGSWRGNKVKEPQSTPKTPPKTPTRNKVFKTQHLFF